jgi:hypothetical protein
MATEEVTAPKEPVEQEYLGLIIPDEMSSKVDEILDVLTSYNGDIPVIIALKGKKYNANVSIRKCGGLLSELKVYLKDNEIVFFKKK